MELSATARGTVTPAAARGCSTTALARVDAGVAPHHAPVELALDHRARLHHALAAAGLQVGGQVLLRGAAVDERAVVADHLDAGRPRPLGATTPRTGPRARPRARRRRTRASARRRWRCRAAARRRRGSSSRIRSPSQPSAKGASEPGHQASAFTTSAPRPSIHGRRCPSAPAVPRGCDGLDRAVDVVGEVEVEGAATVVQVHGHRIHRRAHALEGEVDERHVAHRAERLRAQPGERTQAGAATGRQHHPHDAVHAQASSRAVACGMIGA